MPSPSHTQITLSKRAGRLGVTCVNAEPFGALVSSLIQNSVAAAAGLRVGDVITSVNGHLVRGHPDAVALIDQAADVVTLVLAAPTRQCIIDKSKSNGRIGVTCCNKANGAGVLVGGLEEGSLAVQEGVLVGDTVLSVNGSLVHSVRTRPAARKRCLWGVRTPRLTISPVCALPRVNEDAHSLERLQPGCQGRPSVRGSCSPARPAHPPTPAPSLPGSTMRPSGSSTRQRW